MIVIDLPWPSPKLSPNGRLHWAAKAKAVKRARGDAAMAAKAAGVGLIKATSVKVAMVFSPPDKRQRDDDNMLSSCKTYRDSIAQVIGVDDHLWSVSIRREAPVVGGNVRFEIEAAT